ncbi:Stealth protein CR1, conserved region 1 [Parapedobacter composti]|uniref:Stealth protein CR1, conserved region 1 n=1 Tax=Parapedobacter composti TaxID=623281 RepID=A0A1I1DU02_9SPHI|nr:Stealth CR1 domain-containing protein [Parapedobacter composti]SFB78344.1 Stealth protein CR1, conserved region 1 [Parapedobacter composti]
MPSSEQAPIDVVISWVDGNDPAHQQKIAPYLSRRARQSNDIAGPTRYRSSGEIFYCVASIFRFAPFVRKIFIITDNQNPNLDAFIRHNFPDSPIQLEIVDHSVLFSGYEAYLPVFNSRAIETCHHRIPGLSERYVYFNDDFFLVRPVQYSDWYRDDNIVAYGHWRNMPLDRLLWLIKPLKNGHKPIGFKDGMIAAARRLGYRWRYFHLEHMPHPLNRSVLARHFASHPEFLRSNISHKFRSAKQFNTQEMYYLLMFRAGKAILESPKDKFLYLKPVKRGKQYVKRKIATYTANPDIRFCCIGSLDLATETDRSVLLNWLKTILDVNLDAQ